MFSSKQNTADTGWMKKGVVTLCILVILLGVLGMVGWYTHSTLLIQLQAHLTPMQYNTALGFSLCGIGLLALVYHRSRLAMFCGGLVTIFSLLTLMQYLFGADFGIDRFLFEPDITTKTAFPGRMAPSTALAHLLSGLFLLIMAGGCWPRICILVARAFGISVLALGVGHLLGYAIGGETPYGWSHSTYMAVNTSAGFVLLGIGHLAFLWRLLIKQESGIKAHNMALESGIGLAVLVIILWQSLIAQERLQAIHFIESQADNLVVKIQNSMRQQILAIGRMARRWENQGGTPHALWSADAIHYLQHNKGLEAIMWVDPSTHVSWIEPMSGNETTRNLYPALESRSTRALETARLKHAVVATRNIELHPGGKAIIVYYPLYIDGRFDGYIGGVFRIAKLFKSILNNLAGKDFAIEVFDGNEEIYRRIDAGVVYEPNLIRTQLISIINLDWNLRLLPSQKLLVDQTSLLPLIELIVGLLLALLLALVVDRVHAAQYRASVLELEVAERKRTQEALATSELWQRSIFNAMEEGLLVTTPEWLIVDINPASQAMLGYSQAEVAGLPMAVIHVDHDHVVEFVRRIKVAFDKGEIARFEFELKRKNGEIFPTEHAVSLIRDNAGTAMGIVSTLRDVTIRKQTEQELHHHRGHLEDLIVARTGELHKSRESLRELTAHLQSVREDERASIAREVHDELGQALLALSLDIHWVDKNLSAPDLILREKIKSILDLIDATVESVQRITTQLRPALLDDLGMEAAIPWYAGEFQQRTGIKCDTKVVLDGVSIDNDKNITIFRILQEALTNVGRHSGASHVNIFLEVKGGQFLMTIRDDGKGISNEQLHNRQSFGLQGMRERAMAFGGEVLINNNAGGGTVVILTMPLTGC